MVGPDQSVPIGHYQHRHYVNLIAVVELAGRLGRYLLYDDLGGGQCVSLGDHRGAGCTVG